MHEEIGGVEWVREAQPRVVREVVCGHIKHSDMGRVTMGKMMERFAWAPCTWVDEFGTLSMVIGRILG